MTAIERIATATLGTEWEGRLYLVGGAVRDSLLNLPTTEEFDIVVEGSALDVVQLLWEQGVSALHPVCYPRFGTALIRVSNSNVEFVSARKESYSPETRKPNVAPATLLDDALRRDFTVNALMKNIHSGEVLDLLDKGLDDLGARLLRTPLEPRLTFRDDPLRMLRAVRLKNRLDFELAPGLADAIRSEGDRLRIVSAERVRDELIKMLVDPSASKSMHDLMSLGLFDIIAPELVEGVGVEQGDYHSKDVWGHTLDVVEVAAAAEYDDHQQRLLVVLAALFHDIGKPRTRSVDPQGRVRFFRHEEVGAQMTQETLRRLRFPKRLCRAVARLVGNHMRLGSASKFSKSAVRRLLRDMGRLTEPLLQLCEADAAAIGRIPKPIPFDEIRRQLHEVMTKTETAPLGSPLNGREIMEELGIAPGPEVARWKKLLTEAVLDGDVPQGDREAALAFIRKRSNHG